MDLETRDDGGVTIITVGGDLVIGDAESTFKKTVTRLLEEGRVNLLIDLSAVGFLDSSGPRRPGPGADQLAEGRRAGQAPERRPPDPQAPPDDQARLGFRDPRGHGGRRLELLTPVLRLPFPEGDRWRTNPRNPRARPVGAEDERGRGAGLGPGGARALREPRPDLRLGRALERHDGRRRRDAALGARHGPPHLPLHRRRRRGRREVPEAVGAAGLRLHPRRSSATGSRSCWRARS